MDGFYYDLEAFGEELKNIRKSLGLSQGDVSKHGFINRDTLRKIENGKVLPKQETLELLSHLYKKDLNELLLKQGGRFLLSEKIRQKEPSLLFDYVSARAPVGISNNVTAT
ncbi:helix-turn-helix protein [Caldanaerobacter subterraneus subsp. pacificus DSM 12653]|jgi:transcriptional regulator with XRE-family HTH domain|uniref:Helix-turn-helix protein n=1 Tax=Caldanaerobacter subterraneus subsp. pacificus DSM 12653 TaxID=391606 RepID=A0A0F5PIS1_9THEO|nr:helix-turn-helix protein [Caldanaerobacter subterraneus subsp. pacificus DSM 12653]